MRDGTAVFARTGQREGLFLRSRPTGASAPALSREIIGALMDFPFTSAIPRKRSVATRGPKHVRRQDEQSQYHRPVVRAKKCPVAALGAYAPDTMISSTTMLYDKLAPGCAPDVLRPLPPCFRPRPFELPVSTA